MTTLMHPILNFDQLSVEQAYRILQNEIVPLCKQKGVKLCVYLGSVKKDNKQKKVEERLCNVEKVQKVFRLLDEAIVNHTHTHQSISLYRIKNIIEERRELVTHAECIAAMLAKGYIADFSLDRGKLGINCKFYTKLNKK